MEGKNIQLKSFSHVVFKLKQLQLFHAEYFLSWCSGFFVLFFFYFFTKSNYPFDGFTNKAAINP